LKMKKVESFLENIMEKEEINKIIFYHGEWCDRCHGTGYKGRLGIHEVLILWDYLEPLILAQESANNMAKEAIKHWMITIVQDAILKAALWDTTLEEALKLI
jgi:type II secretory ATPase GspE/PulE/Tfp pilus assembly ATPase PilB-like protein